MLNRNELLEYLKNNFVYNKENNSYEMVLKAISNGKEVDYITRYSASKYYDELFYENELYDIVLSYKFDELFLDEDGIYPL